MAVRKLLSPNGSHDFDFLIGDWKAHVRRLPDRLNRSNAWYVYDGVSNHKKLLDTNANFEEFDVSTTVMFPSNGQVDECAECIVPAFVRFLSIGRLGSGAVQPSRME